MKEKLKLLLEKHPGLFQFFSYFYTVCFHRRRLMKKKSFGNRNSKETIFVVRPNAEDGIQGLLSLVCQSLRWINYADDNHYLSFVDYKNYHTQYSNGVDNVWEYYFLQPSAMMEDEVYSSKNVQISGVTLRPRVDNNLFSAPVFWDSLVKEKSFQIIAKHLRFNEDVLRIVQKEAETLNVEDCIGLYIRGTDYTALKPTGEYVQPDIEEMISKIDDFTKKYGEKKLFLVTEDETYYNRLREVYGDRMCLASFDSFIKNYDGHSFLSESGALDADKKKRGMDYLVKIILLSKCRYFISSITKGSVFAYCLNNNQYEDEFVFNHGVYK